MEKIFFTIKENAFVSPSLPSPYTLPPPQPTIDTNGGAFDLSGKVSPSVLLIIIILAIIFFVSGLLHLLVRFFIRPGRVPDDLESVTALQGQLQQLFHLHDAGVDQSFIDTLPVFNYKAIIGLKDPFDCAVCLCEFEAEDKLRLLPKCSHAFHMDCIDTWLLSHSTCPLCRASLLSDFSPNNTCSPVVLVLESGSESSREIVNDRDCNFGRSSSILTAHSHLGSQRDLELGSTNVDYLQKSGEVLEKEDKSVLTAIVVDSGEKVVPVKLGKFRNVDIGEGCSTTNSIDSRRCYSMGSFEYVLDENSSLQVPIRTPTKKQSNKKPSLPLTPGHRQAMSECDCESRREFSGFEGILRSNVEVNNNSSSNSNSILRSKKESFSISKIWLRSKNETQKPTESSSRKAASFRFPLTKNVTAEDDLKVKDNVNGISRRTNSEMGSEWCDMIVENHQSCNISLDSQAKTPSFARRTLNWLVGKQNKVVHSSFVTPKE